MFTVVAKKDKNVRPLQYWLEDYTVSINIILYVIVVAWLQGAMLTAVKSAEEILALFAIAKGVATMPDVGIAGPLI